ncbi:unnamed protein product [Cyprideis torosa]|uniref:Uncharacterized protein n=1 Tax=Cyprideis torosa TaxID=163714 RepID=A0A7R8W1Z9_9CRUS|nr:unnamed protein product [Cyprideis torosa]CAG0880419.1 unnamed protein product [Cyprideis torosa]
MKVSVSCDLLPRKKKCIRYLSGGNSGGSGERDSGAGSLDNPNSIEDPLSVSSYGAGSDDASPSTTSSDTTANFLSSPLMMPSPLTSPPSNVPFSPMNISSPYSSVPSPALPPLNRNPVGTNPHDINNPLSVNQLTGQCNPLKPPAGLVKPEPSPIAALSAMTKPANVVSVNT